MEAMTRICADGYLPSDQDILRARIPTTGVIEYQFNITRGVNMTYVLCWAHSGTCERCAPEMRVCCMPPLGGEKKGLDFV